MGKNSASIQGEHLTHNGPPEIVTESLVTANDWYKAAQEIDLTSKENAEKRIGYYQQVIKLDPSNISALGGISWTYAGFSDVQNASEYLEKILQLQPLNTYFLNQKAFYLEAQGKNEEATAIRDKVDEIISDSKPFLDTEKSDQNVTCDKSNVGVGIAKSGCL
jgi:tetratricopeptide (TPR) repeat protein